MHFVTIVAEVHCSTTILICQVQ